ncbi:MAG: TlpA family protein disulfide reductase [Porticoccaceae bacterium]|nr:TlpA family protein disulfide reductase [Porticoccaceae bacterium]
MFRKPFRILAPLALCAALVACGDKAPQGPLPENPENKVTFINYWAEWCRPCREEIPELNNFQQAHGDQVRVFGVNFDGAKDAELERQESLLGVAFATLAVDPGPSLGLPRPTGLPITIVLDREGRVVQQLEGEQTLETLEGALYAVLESEGQTP